MSVKVRIPSPLRNFTNGADVVEADGGNVGEVLDSLKAKAAGIETRLFKGEGQLNRFVNVYVNDEDIRFLENLDDAGEGRRRDQHRPGDRGRAVSPAVAGSAEGTCSRLARASRPPMPDPALQPPVLVHVPVPAQVEQPIIWQMSRKFPDVVFDIRQASVQNEIGIMAVLLSGTEADVIAAVAFCRSQGLQVDPIEKSVIEG